MLKLSIFLAAITFSLYAEEVVDFSKIKYQPSAIVSSETFDSIQLPLPNRKLFDLPVQGKVFVDPDKEDSQRDKLVGEMNYKPEGSSIGFKGGLGVDKQGSRSIEFAISWE